MSQTPAPKPDPEAASTPTPAAQTPTTSYTPGSWAAGRKFLYIYICKVVTDLSNLIRNTHRPGASAAICECHVSTTRFRCSWSQPVLGLRTTRSSSILTIRKLRTATTSLTSLQRKLHSLKHLRL